MSDRDFSIKPVPHFPDASGKIHKTSQDAAKANMMLILQKNLNKASSESAIKAILEHWEDFKTLGDYASIEKSMMYRTEMRTDVAPDPFGLCV